MKEVWVALGLTVFAGMATGIGSAIAFATKRTNYRFLSIATDFSAGVMLYVSFVEMILRLFLGNDTGVIPPQVMGVLFGGVAGIMVYISLDELLPRAGPTAKVTIAFSGSSEAC